MLGKFKGKGGKKKELDQETLAELREAFKIFDNKNTGEIDARELKAAMKAFQIDVKKQHIREIYGQLGKELNMGVNFSEFTTIMAQRLGPKDSKEEIMKVFKLFDQDQMGKITFKNLKKIANQVGQKLNDSDLHEMLQEADRDGDGMLNFDQFYRIMRRREDPLDDLDSDDD